MTDTQLTTSTLRDAAPTPIAQLNPELTDPQTRIVEGVVTITWPFSIVSKSIAFILAEPDFRLRRENGQVRLRFHGASAQAIADAKLGGGDEIRLSLQGVKWERNEMETQLAGSTLEWQLEFTNRLLLSVQRAGEGEDELRVIDVDVAEVEEPVTNGVTTEIETETAIPIPQSPEISLPAKRPASSNPESQELSSPAFLKRARLSYGALFEGGFDIFDEPQSKKTSKRRSRFSLPGNAWTYNSRTPSPEVEEVDEEPDQEEQNNEPEAQPETADVPMPTPTRPAMVDGGCQTDDVDFTPMRSVQVLAEARPDFAFPYATPTPLPRSRPDELAQAHPLSFGVGTSTQPEPLLQEATGFHAPEHLDPSLGFNFGAPQTNMFDGPQFSTVQDGAMGVPDDQHFSSAEPYAATFLENHTQPSTAAHSFHSQHQDMETQDSERPHVHFDAEPQFYPPFEEEEPAQPARPDWQASGFTPVNNMENAADFINSSPLVENPEEENSASNRSSSALNEPEREIGLREILDKRPEYDREDEHEEPPAEEEGFFQDGGDRPGDDYDLRNYDRAHADDDDVVGSSEEDPDVGTDDPDAQIMNPEEEDEEHYEDDEEVGDYDEQAQYGEYADEEGEDYSDEEMYDDEDEEESEEERYPRQPAAPKEPVFISLLSDSESEDEDEPEPQPHREPETRVRTEPESEPQSEEDSASESDEETGSEAELPRGPPVELEQAPEIEEPQSLDEPQSPVDSEDSAESDHDEEIAEDAIPVGQEPPSEDRMEVDGDQSPESPREASPESQPAAQDTRPVDRAESESAAGSIERGVPANEHHEEPDEGDIDLIVVEDEVAPASPQGSGDHEEIEETIQVEEVVQVEEIAEVSGDAMEVDDTTEKDDQTAGIVTDSANDTADAVQPSTAENPIIGMETHEEAINVEATNVVEVSTEIVVADGPVSSPAPASNVHEQTTENASAEGQGSGPPRSPDATLHETLQLATSEGSPLDKGPGARSGNGEEENNDQQVNTTTPFSPPATQVQISKDVVEAVLFSQTSTHNPNGTLPTPHDTQQDVEMSAQHPAAEDHGTDEADADSQIMAEFLQQSPALLEGLRNANPAVIGTSPTNAEPSGVVDEEKEQGSENPSPAKAVRKRGRPPGSSKKPPARAGSPVPSLQDDDTTRSFSPQTAPRITRSRADPIDLSAQLDAEDLKQASTSPSGSFRVTRSMTDHDLAVPKESTPTRRQSKRQLTPEVPHRETRASSRGLKSDSPDVLEAVLHSPSVASSIAGDESASANALKLQLLKSLRTDLPDYVSLKSLRGSLNRTVDILAVATTKPDAPQRPKGGPRDYMLSLNLTDPSSAPTAVVVANLFRPHQTSLPVVKAGDVLLLRRVQVVSMKNRGFGVRTGDSSAWAVFEKDDREMLPQIKGPPVETNEGEVRYAEGLRRWWALLDDKSMDKIRAVTDKIIKASKEA